MTELDKELEDIIRKNGRTDTGIKGWISSGYELFNKVISPSYFGGYAVGRLYEMYGQSSTGKTLYATMAMIEAQKLGGYAIFIDYERSFNIDFAERLGLNLDKSQFIYQKPYTWEGGNETAVKACHIIRSKGIIPDDAPIFVVQDSIAAAIPESQSAKGSEYSKLNMNDSTALSRILSTTLKSIKSAAEEYDATFLYLNQERDIPGVIYGPKTTAPGGKAMGFMADGRIHLTRSVEKSKEDDGGIVRQVIKIECIKSKLTAPFKKTQIDLRFDEFGMAYFDAEAGLIQHMVDKGILEMDGRTLIWEGERYFGAPKIAGLAQSLRENGQRQKLEDLLREYEETEAGNEN